jgi:dTDP-4-dehydrorhamnose reductase
MSTGKEYHNPAYPELWGGVECTINRVGNDYRDQLQDAGHYGRPDDIERFAQLGIRKLRYPILWEKHEQVEGQQIDWRFTGERLSLIRKQGIEVIAGLVHHGSGPSFTNLYDPLFAEKLAVYAKKTAEQFPFLNYYTPVNEPLTTARFSGLYGLWFPHHKNEKSFIVMLLNQLKGIILSMQAIRTVNPHAKLVQTEDLCKIHSSPAMAYQATFENERRWLTYDILCGRFNPDHFFWDYFLRLGIPEADLQFFRGNCLPPEIMGFNYYITSERYLDENLENFPAYTHGGNERQAYADTEAVRVNQHHGIKSLLREAWDRYQLPLGITECHLSCTREEQMRWMHQCWQDCCSLQQEAVNVVALTAWSLLGAYDWNSLLTRDEKHYEPGIYDLRSGQPRPTAMVNLLQSLSNKRDFNHPLLEQEGWWQNKQIKTLSKKKTPPLLIIGKQGTLATAFSKICAGRSIPFIALSRADINIMDRESIRKAIDQYAPWALVNTTGYVRVDDAESNSAECYAVNAQAPEWMAELARQKGIRFMTFSSDLVFDGQKKDPYTEDDVVKPLNVYGASKVSGEKKVSYANPESLIIRTSAFFGPWDRFNFIYQVGQSLEQERVLSVVSDVVISPTYVPDLVHTSLDLFIDEEEGIWHLSNQGSLSWAELAAEVARRKGHSLEKLQPTLLAAMGWKAQRPLYSALVSEKGARLAPLENALERYFRECAV